MQTITIDNITYNLVPVETAVTPVEYKKPRYKEYYYSDDLGNIDSHTDNRDEIDNFLYTTHNYFEKREEAEQYRDYLLALGRINHRIFEMNEGWVADWNDNSVSKCYPYFNKEDKKWDTNDTWEYNIMTIFTYAKSEDIFKTLFVEMKDDFETVRVWMMR